MIAVVTGSELLSGGSRDANLQAIARRFASWGVRVESAVFVPDERGPLARALREAFERSTDGVVVCGGLGPTPDDLTRAALAEAFGRPLEEREEVLSGVLARARGQDEAVLRAYALVPRGFAVVPNAAGLAPGLYAEVGAKRVVALPGPPVELRAVLDALAQARAQARKIAGEPRVERTVYTFGLTEVEVQAALRDVPRDDVAFLPETGGGVRVVTRGARARELADTVETALGDAVYSREAGLAETLLATLGSRTLAVAESCTGGGVAAALTDVAGASRAFAGGVVAYSRRVKRALLGVPRELTEGERVYSPECAEAMASGVARVLGTSVGLSTTGVTGPSGGSEAVPVGTVAIGTWVEGRAEATTHCFRGDRERVRLAATRRALWEALLRVR